jgi:anti-sigma factor RsiW
MNADPTDTSSPHLDLEELIDEVTGQAMAERAREHLAVCERCRAEVKRWDLVADSVRALAAAAPEVAQPPRPRRTGPQVRSGSRRRVSLVASAAAALLLLGAASYGAAAALTGHAPGTGAAGTKTATGAGTKASALTAVSGCAGLKQAEGTLEQVNGSSLVIKTASGQSVTVTTTASTTGFTSVAPVSDITNGATVMVVGRSSDGTVAARVVAVRSPVKAPVSVTPAFYQPGMTAVYGTAADTSAAGFTVVTSAGTRVPVTIPGHINIRVIDPSPSQLVTGATTIAVGYVQPGGALSAAMVIQPPADKINMQLDLGGCTPTSIDQAYSSAYGSGS